MNPSFRCYFEKIYFICVYVLVCALYLCMCLHLCFVCAWVVYACIPTQKPQQVLDPSKLMLQAFTGCLSCYLVSRPKLQPLKSRHCTLSSAIKCYFYCNTIYSTLILL